MISMQSFFIKAMLCLFEAGPFFIPFRQGEIPLETDEIPAKVGQKSP